MLRPIVKLGDPTLVTPARPVEAIDPGIEQLIDDMVATMYAAPGVGWRRPRSACHCASA